jgi:hypothetical protein
MRGYILKNLLLLSGHMSAKPASDPTVAQAKLLRQLLHKAKATRFGKYYDFARLLRNSNNAQLVKAFAQAVPIHNYELMQEQWWHLLGKGEHDVSWPGTAAYFALSSGTSQSASKYLPLTKDSIRSVKQAGTEMARAIAAMPGAAKMLEGKMLSLNGSTTLQQYGGVEAGDFSGIMMKNSPDWYKERILPPIEVHALKSWSQKLDHIVQHAPQWDVAILSAFPVWAVPMMEAVMEKYRLNNIHEIWPNLALYLHGGMSIEPYRLRLANCFAKPLPRLESYVASEGYIAHQLHPDSHGMDLICHGGLYFEFVPFGQPHFDDSGSLTQDAKAITLQDVEANKLYALLLSSNSGAWRYLLGDVIRFTSLMPPRVQWMGRTAQFVSLAGEHVSVANLEMAFARATATVGAQVNEFAVWPDDTNLPVAHRWIVAASEVPESLIAEIDAELCRLNDDYHTLRKQQLLGRPTIHSLANSHFDQWMKGLGKTDAQHKYLRVVKKGQLPQGFPSTIG